MVVKTMESMFGERVARYCSAVERVEELKRELVGEEIRLAGEGKMFLDAISKELSSAGCPGFTVNLPWKGIALSFRDDTLHVCGELHIREMLVEIAMHKDLVIEAIREYFEKESEKLEGEANDIEERLQRIRG